MIMGYEHERWIKHLIELRLITEGYNPNEETKAVEELQEVYAKAKAFDEIRNVDKDFYKEYGYYPNEEEWWYDASNIIEKYEELHGGHKQ